MRQFFSLIGMLLLNAGCLDAKSGKIEKQDSTASTIPDDPYAHPCDSDDDCDYFDQELTCEGDRLGTHEGVCRGGQCADKFTTIELCVSGCYPETLECRGHWAPCRVDADCQQWQPNGTQCVDDSYYSYELYCEQYNDNQPDGDCMVRKKLLGECTFSCNTDAPHGCFPYTGSTTPFNKPVTVTLTPQNIGGTRCGLFALSFKTNLWYLLLLGLTFKIETADRDWATLVTAEDGLWMDEVVLNGEKNELQCLTTSVGKYTDNPQSVCWEAWNENRQPVAPGEPVRYLRYTYNIDCRTAVHLLKNVTNSQLFSGFCNMDVTRPDDLVISLIAENPEDIWINNQTESGQSITTNGIEGVPISVPAPFWDYYFQNW